MGSIVAILIGLAVESCNSEERVSAAERAADVTALDRKTSARQPGGPTPPTKAPATTRPSEQRRPPKKRAKARQRPSGAKPAARRATPKRPRCVPRPVVNKKARTDASTPRKLAKPQLAQKPAKDALDVTKARRSVTKAESANGKSWVPEPVRPPLRLDTRRHYGASPSYGSPR